MVSGIEVSGHPIDHEDCIAHEMDLFHHARKDGHLDLFEPSDLDTSLPDERDE